MDFNYHDLTRTDIIRVLKPLFDAGKLSADGVTGKIRVNNGMAVSSPWLHTVPLLDTPCYFYWEVCFHLFGFIHSRCQTCYKVVARPETLEQLTQMHDIQLELGHPCKCGIEDRNEVPANYGGYWYNRSLEEGLDTLDKVRAALKPIGVDNIFLKRGCTEYETHFGDSIGWKKTKPEKEFEEMVDNLFDLTVNWIQPEYAKKHTQRLWVEFAWSRGDMTCLKYIGGPLYPPYRTYEREK